MKRLVLLLVGALLFNSVAFAGDYTWTNLSGGLFSDTLNWSPSGYPQSSDNAIFNLGDTYAVTFDGEYSNQILRVDGGDVTFNMDSRSYYLDYEEQEVTAVNAIIGGANPGKLTINNGWVHSKDLSITENFNSIGKLTIGTDGGWECFRNERWYGAWIGANGQAELYISGQLRHGHGASCLNEWTKAKIEVNGTDAEWSVDGWFGLGWKARTELNVTGGASVSMGVCEAGIWPGGYVDAKFEGLYGQDTEFNLTNPDGNSLSLGKRGYASIKLINGKIWNHGYMTIGEFPGGFGSLYCTQGSWLDNDKSVYIGGIREMGGGTGVLTNVESQLNIGKQEGMKMVIWPQGTYNMSGGELILEYGIEGTNYGNDVIVEGGTFNGRGMVWANVINKSGKVNITGETDKKLEIGYNYTQEAKGTISFELGGTDWGVNYSCLQVNGNGYGAATVDGILRVRLINGYLPNSYDDFTIIAAQQVNGKFLNAREKLVFESGTFDVIYNADSVVLTNYRPEPACIRIPDGDFNYDCKVDFTDFAMFASWWLDCGLYPTSYCQE